MILPGKSAVWLLASALVCAIGCGGGSERVEVRGQVTYGGRPVEQGEIRFMPIEDTSAPVSGAAIADGHYKVDAKGGVPVGKYKVSIQADVVNLRPPSPSSGPTDRILSGAVRKQYLPAKYNRNTELRLTVPSGSRAIIQDYDLVK